MPMILTPDVAPVTPYGKQRPSRNPFCHQHRVASKCGHNIHPSNSEHTPWCHTCTLALARARRDVANQELVAEGGLHPPNYMRDWWWNYARKAYLIAKQRLEKVQRDGQLRCEREEAWDDAHQRHSFLRSQAAVLPQTQHHSLCIVCDSMASSYPTNMPEASATDHAVAWWEKPGALVNEPEDAPETETEISRQPRNRNRRGAHTTQGNSRLRTIVQRTRRTFHALQVQRQAWRFRAQAEVAVRRKCELRDDFIFTENHWRRGVHGMDTRMIHRKTLEKIRHDGFVARGKKLPPLPPRSSLSHWETTEGMQDSPEAVKELLEKEEKDALERAIERLRPRVAEEVGYLYFVGDETDAAKEWNDAWEISDLGSIVRDPQIVNSETSGSEDENSVDEDPAEDGGDGTNADEAEGGGDSMDVDS